MKNTHFTGSHQRVYTRNPDSLSQAEIIIGVSYLLNYTQGNISRVTVSTLIQIPSKITQKDRGAQLNNRLFINDYVIANKAFKTPVIAHTSRPPLPSPLHTTSFNHKGVYNVYGDNSNLKTVLFDDTTQHSTTPYFHHCRCYSLKDTICTL